MPRVGLRLPRETSCTKREGLEQRAQRIILRDHLHYCERTVEAELARGDAAIQAAGARQLPALDPRREASHRWLMHALMCGGNAVQAAQVSVASRHELRIRTGMTPAAAAEHLYARLRWLL